MARRTHATCGFCLKAVIVRSHPHETRGGQMICPKCLDEWKNIFDDGKLITYTPFTNSPNRRTT